MDNDVKNVSGAQFPQPPEEFAVRSATSAYKFLTEGVPPPFPCYVGVDDRLFVFMSSDVALNSVFVAVRILRPDGEIIPLFFTVGNAALRSFSSQTFNLPEGFILSCGVTTTGATGTASIVYCQVGINRLPGGQNNVYEVLCAGYVNNAFTMAYPQSQPQRLSDGTGQPRSIVVGVPAAGVDFTFTIPGNTRMRIVSLSATLTTAVAVANRNVELVIDDGANVIAEITSGFSQVASLVSDYTWMDSGPRDAAFDGVVVLPLPAQLYLPSGFRIRSETTAIQAADQWSAITLFVHEWFDAG